MKQINKWKYRSAAKNESEVEQVLKSNQECLIRKSTKLFKTPSKPFGARATVITSDSILMKPTKNYQMKTELRKSSH